MRKTIFPFILSLILLGALAFLLYYPILASNPINDFSYLETVPSYEIRINDHDEYNTFLKNQKNLPENFVTAEMLKCFGSFEQFYCEDEATIGGYDGYSYVLKPNDFPRITFFIYHKSLEHSLTPIDRSALSTENMAKITTKEGSVIICDEGIEYRYLFGNLDKIVWTIGDVQIILRSNGGINLHEFPKDHILGKALSKDPEDQLYVYNQLKIMIEGSNK